MIFSFFQEMNEPDLILSSYLLYYLRLFSQAFLKCDALRHELSWTHYRLLLRVENQDARDWYMNEAAAENWLADTSTRIRRNRS